MKVKELRAKSWYPSPHTTTSYHTARREIGGYLGHKLCEEVGRRVVRVVGALAVDDDLLLGERVQHAHDAVEALQVVRVVNI